MFTFRFKTKKKYSTYRKTLLQKRKFKLKNSKRLTAHLVIGISTVKRENNSYLITMLDSLFRAMNNKEKDKVLIVLLIAEVNFLVLAVV